MSTKLNVFKNVYFLIFIVSLMVFSVAAVKKYYRIDPLKCDNCAECVDVCPEGAISVGKVNKKDIHIIDKEKCTDCGACFDICPQNAIIHETGETKKK